jgi:DNA topoisomerase VI subunit B
MSFVRRRKPKESALSTVYNSEVETITCDSHRLQQMIWNLLTNAVKFTPPTAGRNQTRTKGRYVQIIVSDTGQGISPEFLPFVFDRFRQADSSSTRCTTVWVWGWQSCVIWRNCTAARSAQPAKAKTKARLLLDASVFADCKDAIRKR